MAQVSVVPMYLADLLYNAAILAEVPKNTKGLDLVLLEATDDKLTASAAGSHTAGRGAIDLLGPNEEGPASVLITAAEAMELQSEVRKTSRSKTAAIIITIDEDGLNYHDEDGNAFPANLVVTWQGNDLCALEDVDPEGVTSPWWDLLDEYMEAQPKEAISMSFSQKAIGLLGKLKPPRDHITLKMGDGRFATAYTEGWVVVIADQRPDKKLLDELKRTPSRAED